jgi:outer membrane translocation and assembly module TamA
LDCNELSAAPGAGVDLANASFALMVVRSSATCSRAFDTLALVAFLAATLVLGGCRSIPEGRSSVNEVQIRGADKVDEGDIKDKIATTETSKFLLLFRGILFDYSLFDRFVLQRDLARVEAFYRSKGYYDVHARAGRVHAIDDKHIRVEIIVEEGDAVLVREVHVDGLDGLPPEVVAAAQKAAATGLLTNKPFEEETFKSTEGMVRRALTDRGYAYAKVKADAAVDIVTHKTDIVLSVTPGPTCVFGEVKLEGLGGLPDAPIRRTVDIKPGAPYSQQVLEDAQQALLDLGVFASVELVPDIPGTPEEPNSKPESAPTDGAKKKDDKGNEGEGTASPGAQGPPLGGPPIVPIRVKLEPSRLRTIRLGFGLEFDSLKTDVHGIIGWEHRNFLGGLRRFSVQFRPGVVLYPIRVNNIVAPQSPLPEERLRVDFTQPGLFEARTNGFIRPEFNIYPVLINPNPLPEAPVIGYGEARNAVGLERTWWKLYGSISHNLQVAYPFSYVGPKDPTLSLIIISYPELLTTLDFRDNKIHPRKGIFVGNSLQVAGLGGSATDVKIQPELRGYVPVTKKLVWAARASFGVIEAPNYGKVVQEGPSGDQPPSTERTKDYQLTFFRGFFSGGPNSNRGYPIRGVSPYDIVPFLTPEIEAGRINAICSRDQITGKPPARCLTPTGGFTLWEASMEARYTLTGPLSVAAFCDASDVSPQVNNPRFAHLHLSCGGGGRYDTPAGPIRLDIGYRIPGLQVLGGLTPDERAPEALFGIPIAVHIGIGEAY